ncbi:hypothetical protein H0A36_00835 [Endozoicomonas sp. SM1973]|uniref:THAP4-like heme-binding beta-barrel domain-containing protein n=1 Tax=Spartinivicinus marinus TaxID=2994442 RepID=A0A853I3J9_9GAMM|nr:hypothetical protein [Spartinivicinus marinus]MCX4026697.1 hypothetical protein [Spartinivicinus marinus]NYZ64531.1 hypothetical protein [Spartinivicinus marinus]
MELISVMPIHLKSNTLTAATIAFALSVSPIIKASECFNPSPHHQKSKDTFQPIESKKLTYSENKTLKSIFKHMDGRWTGTATGFFCMGTDKTPREKPDSYIIQEMEVDTNSSGDLVLSAQLLSETKETSRQENMRLFISSGILRVGQNSKSGDTSLDSAAKNKIVFTQKYRIPTRQGGKIKGSIAQEIIRTIHASRSSMTIEYNVYTQGVLSSKSVWKLRKK